jgi:sulfite reductase alpha subunit-like flavoprotein
MVPGGDQTPGTHITGHRRILVIYGSETGNAEDVAVSLGKMSERLHFAVSVDEMNDVSLVGAHVASVNSLYDLSRSNRK